MATEIDYNDPLNVGIGQVGGTNLDKSIYQIASNLNANYYNSAMNQAYNKKETSLKKTNKQGLESTSSYYANKVISDNMKANTGISGGGEELLERQELSAGLSAVGKTKEKAGETLTDYRSDVQTIQSGFDEKVLQSEAKLSKAMFDVANQYAVLTGYMYSPEVLYNYGMYLKTGNSEHLDYLSANGYWLDDNGNLAGGKSTLAREQFEEQMRHNKAMEGYAASSAAAMQSGVDRTVNAITALYNELVKLGGKEYSNPYKDGFVNPGGGANPLGGPGGDDFNYA